MKLTALLAGLLCLFATAAAAQLPATIDPSTLGPQTFQDTFQTLNAGPDATALVTPLHKWRTIMKGQQTPATADCCSDSASTWFGDPSDGQGGAPSTGGPNGLAITAAKRVQPFGRTWRSGVLTTQFSFSQLHGYFEVYANLPTCVQGAWPGFWMLPTSGVWPLHGEIDAPEAVGTGQYFWTVHSAATGQATQVQAETPANCTRGYHRYGILWTASTIGFYLDRKLVAQAATPTDYTVPMYMLLDLNVGGAWPGAPAASLSQVQMLVKEVDAWPLACPVVFPVGSC